MAIKVLNMCTTVQNYRSLVMAITNKHKDCDDNATLLYSLLIHKHRSIG